MCRVYATCGHDLNRFEKSNWVPTKKEKKKKQIFQIWISKFGKLGLFFVLHLWIASKVFHIVAHQYWLILIQFNSISPSNHSNNTFCYFWQILFFLIFFLFFFFFFVLFCFSNQTSFETNFFDFPLTNCAFLNHQFANVFDYNITHLIWSMLGHLYALYSPKTPKFVFQTWI